MFFFSSRRRHTIWTGDWSSDVCSSDLWEVCHSTANPAVVELTGEQLAHMIERGNNAEFQQTTDRPLRGRPRGPLHVAGVRSEERRVGKESRYRWRRCL